jgi:hypothetical protein
METLANTLDFLLLGAHYVLQESSSTVYFSNYGIVFIIIREILLS